LRPEQLRSLGIVLNNFNNNNNNKKSENNSMNAKRQQIISFLFPDEI